MSLVELLKPKQSAIVDLWFNEVLSQFPPQTVEFFKKRNKQFSNPIGYNLYEGISILTAYLMGEETQDKAFAGLDEMIKILAIQEWTPSQALSFIFALKKVLIDETGQEIQDKSFLSQWLKLESEIDSLALVAFDLFVHAREKIFDIRANQLKNRTFKLLEQANFISEKPDAYQLSENCSCL